MGHGVMRRIISAFAAAHSFDAGNPPAKHSRMAQSIGYELAAMGATVTAVPVRKVHTQEEIERIGMMTILQFRSYIAISFSLAQPVVPSPSLRHIDRYLPRTDRVALVAGAAG